MNICTDLGRVMRKSLACLEREVILAKKNSNVLLDSDISNVLSLGSCSPIFGKEVSTVFDKDVCVSPISSLSNITCGIG